MELKDAACPNCGHIFSLNINEADTTRIHVAPSGTAIICPKCKATFSVSDLNYSPSQESNKADYFFLLLAAVVVGLTYYLY